MMAAEDDVTVTEPAATDSAKAGGLNLSCECPSQADETAAEDDITSTELATNDDARFPMSPGVRKAGSRPSALAGGKGAWKRVRATQKAATITSAWKGRFATWSSALQALRAMRWQEVLRRLYGMLQAAIMGRQFQEMKAAFHGGPRGLPGQCARPGLSSTTCVPPLS
jgi:hypothetical protein